MAAQVLVAYATRAGSTAGVAEAIARTLGEAGLEPTLTSVDKAGAPDRYEGVVLGSAVQRGRWLPEAVAWLKANGPALAEHPLALYSVCLSVCTGKPEGVDAIRAFVAQQTQGLAVVDHATLAGAFDPDKLSWTAKTLLRLLRAPEGDHRDWEAITGWAQQVAPRLGGG